MKRVIGISTALALAAGGTGVAVAHGPGMVHGQGNVPAHAGAHVGAKKAVPCTTTKTVNVGYVLKGTVTAVADSAVTIDLAGANKHARRALASATPSVRISRTATNDLFTVQLVSTARVTRQGAVGVPLVGDRIVVQYRAPMTVPIKCAGTNPLVVTVSGTPQSAQFSGTGVRLVRVTARAPIPA